MRELSFVIPVKFDTIDRLVNLCRIYGYHSLHNPDSPFFLVEHYNEDSFTYFDGRGFDIVEQHRIMYYDEGRFFNKSKAINQGCKMVETELVCIHDTDCIIHPSKYKEACQLLEEYDFVIPYDGRHYNLEKTAFDGGGIMNGNYRLDFDKIPEESLDLVTKTSVGGIVLSKKSVLKEIGWYNQNFAGWGEEDFEILERLKSFGYRYTHMDGYLIHFEHDHAIHGYGHENYLNNYDEHVKVKEMTDEERREYVKTWSWK